MPGKRRIRDYIVHDTKERPHARAIIEREAGNPRFSVTRPRVIGMVTRCAIRMMSAPRSAATASQKQMAKMAAWGEFGDDVANAFMDAERYHYTQDRLLEWPDQAF